MTLAGALVRHLAAALLAALVLAPLARAEEVAIRAAEHDGYGRIALDFAAPIEYAAHVDNLTLRVHFGRVLHAEFGALAHALPAYVASSKLEDHGTTLTARLKRPLDANAFTVHDTTVVIDLTPAAHQAPPAPAERKATHGHALAKAKSAHSRAAVAANLNAIAPTEAPAAPAAAAPLAPEEAPTPAASTPAPATADAEPSPSSSASSASPANVPVHLLTVDGGVALRFEWPSATAAAVFTRENATFIVFAAAASLDLADPLAKGQQAFATLAQMAGKNATILRVMPRDPLVPAVRRDGPAWIVEFRQQAVAVDAPIAFEAHPESTPAKILLHVAGAGAPVTIADPALGTLIVVPVADLGRGVVTPQEFVDFSVLPSIEGIVLHPRVADLALHAEADTLELTRPGGLELSNDRDRLMGHRPTDAARIFDFAAWIGPGKPDYDERRGELERAITLAPEGGKTAPRLALAQYYFANQFAAETLAVLAAVAHDDPAALDQPPVKALKGASCLLVGDLKCADDALRQPSLDGQSEVTLWRASLSNQQGDEEVAAKGFLASVSLLPTYPKVLRERFALEAADAMVDTNRAALAGPLIDLVLHDKPDTHEEAMALYLEGRFQEATGLHNDALQSWDKAVALADPPSRARALYARALALYDSGQKSRSETIEALDALRFAWRGDRFEFGLLRMLGEMELAEGRQSEGLEALTTVVANFADQPASKDVAKEASDAFASLFLGAHDGDLPPLKALALYDRFHDVEPVGERRDKIVKKLIDRLVSVDLLDRAAGLLKEQVSTRLSGADKARGTTQLAVLDLMNREPDAALKALDLDVGHDIPPDLARSRQQLRARVLTELGRPTDALALIMGDQSRDADRLRADIYWRAHDWLNASRVLARLAGQPPADGKIDAETARYVVSLAAALTLDDDQQSLAKLRAAFGPALAASTYADAFAVLAGSGASGAVKGAADPLALATQVAQLGELKNFMAAYKDAAAPAAKPGAVN
ncbi:MAG TPA: hypothetical protein VLV50_16150 [Stellaceae bacterium]|nr:hypothetical protein [Stellaceae bacterium]